MRTIIYTLLLITTLTTLKAQDVQLYGEVGEIITLSVSGFADCERSLFSFALKTGGNYSVDIFDRATGKISFLFTEPQKYEFDFYEELNGCINSTSVSFLIKEKTTSEPEPPTTEKESITITIPNIFTPNGDGINDGFHIKYNICPDKFSINIYTRGGLKVYHSSNPNFVWDGKNNLEGTYFYIIKYNDNSVTKTLAGNVTIAQ